MSSVENRSRVASLTVSVDPDGAKLLIFLTGPLTVDTPAQVWESLAVQKKKSAFGEYLFDLSGLTSLDLDGSAQLLSFMEELRGGGQIKTRVVNLPEAHFSAIFGLAQKALEAPRAPKPSRPTFVSQMGLQACQLKDDLTDLMTFSGELVVEFFRFLVNPRSLRWSTALNVAEVAGVNALPIVCLVSMLLGLVLAFQAAVPMRIFGAELYVADLVGISVVRELGPLMTAVVLAGRSGSAFSAELGAMKAGQEIDAILTMGLKPVRDLVLPRVVATVAMTPLITVMANLMGLLGGNVVLFSLGYMPAVYWNEVIGIVDLSDCFTGLFKALVFGFPVAMTGCQRGLAAEDGPGAVGLATTKGVVTNIVLITILDSLFAVVFYVLGI